MARGSRPSARWTGRPAGEVEGDILEDVDLIDTLERSRDQSQVRAPWIHAYHNPRVQR